MEHWAQKCDGAGVDPAEHSKVCMERDRLSEALGRANADAAYMEHVRDMAQAERDAMAKRLVAAETELGETKAALDGAKLSMKALNEKLVEITAERDVLARIVGQGIDACDHCIHNGTDAPCSEMEHEPICEECLLEKAICCKCYAGSHFKFAGVEKGV